MDASEQLSMPHNQEVFERGQRVDYYNAKRLNEYQKSGANTGELMKEHKALMMTNSRHYGNVGINTSVSAVHVPTNVFDGGKSNVLPLPMQSIAARLAIDLVGVHLNNPNRSTFFFWQFNLNVRAGRDERHCLVGAVGQNLHFQLRIGSFFNLAVFWQFHWFHAPISRFGL